jgi:hypothetical protein
VLIVTMTPASNSLAVRPQVFKAFGRPPDFSVPVGQQIAVHYKGSRVWRHANRRERAP